MPTLAEAPYLLPSERGLLALLSPGVIWGLGYSRTTDLMVLTAIYGGRYQVYTFGLEWPIHDSPRTLVHIAWLTLSVLLRKSTIPVPEWEPSLVL